MEHNKEMNLADKLRFLADRCVGWVNIQIEGDIYIASRNIHLVKLVLDYAQTPIAERNARP